MNRDLEIFYGDCRVGLFGITERAEYYIAYDDEWMKRGSPVSVHLPLESKIHGGKPVECFIENLLPEAGIRLAIAQHHGVSANNYFSLMLHIGRDCAGAFSLGAPQSAGEYKALTNEELKKLLIHLPQYPFASNRAGASFSLAGAQNKIPLFQKQAVASKVIEHLPDVERELNPLADTSDKSFAHDLRQNILLRSMNLWRMLKR